MSRKVHIEVYKDHKRVWRWRMKAKGRIIGASSEGYSRVGRCLDNLYSVTGVLTQRWIHLHGAPIKREGAVLITGRIESPLKFSYTFDGRS